MLSWASVWTRSGVIDCAERLKTGQCVALLGLVRLETVQDDCVTMHAHTYGHGQKTSSSRCLGRLDVGVGVYYVSKQDVGKHRIEVRHVVFEPRLEVGYTSRCLQGKGSVAAMTTAGSHSGYASNSARISPKATCNALHVPVIEKLTRGWCDASDFE